MDECVGLGKVVRVGLLGGEGLISLMRGELGLP